MQQDHANLARHHFIGGSDARIIMGQDEKALVRLWQEKRGEVGPEDLSTNLIVQLGLVTEDLNRQWYERNTGNAIKDVQCGVMVGDVLEAYERLILDAMRGDHTLFTTAEGIERLWEVSIPLLEAPPPVRLYPPGAWGPKSIHQLVAPHAWRLPFERAWRDPNPSGG